MIGVFDSGFGGLTILSDIRKVLPEYDYIYLGDNARAPYGNRSYEIVYEYTWQAVQYLFSQGCNLVIIACNTASAKALRTIQQTHLPVSGLKRVLGVIRPTVEVIGNYTTSKHIGVLATEGTVNSMSYPIELQKYASELIVRQQACPMWVPLIEQNEHHTPAMDYFIDKYLTQLFAQDNNIDTLLLGCTHYPLIKYQIEQWIERNRKRVTVISQGSLVATSLSNYLKRHSDLEQTCQRNGKCCYLTTETSSKFSKLAELFVGEAISATHVEF